MLMPAIDVRQGPGRRSSMGVIMVVIMGMVGVVVHDLSYFK
jgi:hypothetical protein